MASPLQVYHAVLLLCLAGLCISTLEFGVISGSFGPGGIYSWQILQLNARLPGHARVRHVLNTVCGVWGVRCVLLVRLVTLGLLVIVPLGSLLFSIVMGVLVVATLAFGWRRMFGDDGSDQMNTIILLTILLCVGPYGNSVTQQIGLWFIALQACLSYSAAGLAKLASPLWRRGAAVYRIFNTGTYGVPWVADFLAHHRGMSALLCWAVIGMETLFPLCLVLPQPWSWLFLGWGIAFHVQCALIMGLNSFVWAFVATYPALLYVAATLRPGLERLLLS